MAVHKFESRILRTEETAPQTKSIVLSVPPEFSFQPGQFVTLLIPVEGNIQRRSYSVANQKKTNEGNTIEICLNEVEGGRVSPLLHKLNVGDVVQVMGPLGVFVLKEDADKKENVFVATGTGVTPFVPMIETLLAKTKQKVTLFAGYRHETNVLFDDVFKKLAEKHKNFTYEVVISRDKKYEGEHGHVQILLKKHIPKTFSGDFYLCGLFAMIKDVGMLLTKEWKATKDRIIFERYD